MKKIITYIRLPTTLLLFIFSGSIAFAATVFFFYQGTILAYGDAESHINIAKRVIDSITPGLAQLGGIWLPLPHLLMIPFVSVNILWQTGLAGSIVGGVCFMISAVYLYKLVFLITGKKVAAYAAFLLFVLNPNLLYLQATPLSELPLIVFFILSSYYYIHFITRKEDLLALIFASFFGFCATLCRYDGWFLVAFEAIGIIFLYIPHALYRKMLEGKLILFSTLGFFGIFIWFLWDFLILGNPLYFSTSPFSAKSQQEGWLARGQLPAYKHLLTAFVYYLYTSISNIGFWICLCVGFSVVLFLLDKKISKKFIILMILFVPFIFYTATLFLGESVIFIPSLTPVTYPWRLFNVRYGVMMIPFAAFFFGYLVSRVPTFLRPVILGFLFLQSFLFFSGKDPTITLMDGQKGLSQSKNIDATGWMKKHYTGGLVLLDDYSRTLSIIKSGLPIDKVIYIGNKPYWDDSLKKPQKYVIWIILQKNDAVWKALFATPQEQGNLYKYFVKAYTSPTILIFKRNTTLARAQ